MKNTKLKVLSLGLLFVAAVNADDKKANTQATAANTQATAANTQTTAANTQTTAANTQTTAANTQTTAANTQTTAANTQTPAAEEKSMFGKIAASFESTWVLGGAITAGSLVLAYVAYKMFIEEKSKDEVSSSADFDGE